MGIGEKSNPSEHAHVNERDLLSASRRRFEANERSVRVLIIREMLAGQQRETWIDTLVSAPVAQRLVNQICDHERENLAPTPSLLDVQGGSHSIRLGTQESRVISLATPTEIVAIESAGNYIQIHQFNKTYKVRELMSAAYEKLAPFGFARIHRSILINKDAIEQIERIAGGGYIVTMRGGRSFRVARTYRKHLAEWLRSSSRPTIPSGQCQQPDTSNQARLRS